MPIYSYTEIEIHLNFDANEDPIPQDVHVAGFAIDDLMDKVKPRLKPFIESKLKSKLTPKQMKRIRVVVKGN